MSISDLMTVLFGVSSEVAQELEDATERAVFDTLRHGPANIEQMADNFDVRGLSAEAVDAMVKLDQMHEAIRFEIAEKTDRPAEAVTEEEIGAAIDRDVAEKVASGA